MILSARYTMIYPFTLHTNTHTHLYKKDTIIMFNKFVDKRMKCLIGLKQIMSWRVIYETNKIYYFTPTIKL